MYDTPQFLCPDEPQLSPLLFSGLLFFNMREQGMHIQQISQSQAIFTDVHWQKYSIATYDNCC